MNSTRVPELDGIRGLAILAVLLWHCAGRYLDQDWAFLVIRCLHLAWTAVDLFFVLSGFLIGGIVLDNRTATNFFAVFYTRRALRILPPYYLLLIAFVVARGCAVTRELPAAAELFAPSPPLWSYVTFVQNFFFAHSGSNGTPALMVTWSLAVEEQFYLCLPLLVFLVPRARLVPALLGCIAAAPLLRTLLFDLPPQPGYADFVLMPTRADAFLLGVLAAWLVRHEPSRCWMSGHIGVLRSALVVLLAGVVVLHQSYLGFLSFGMMVLGYAWMALFYFCLILVVVTERRGLVKFVTRIAPLRYLGRISYTVYLFHVPVLVMVFAWLSGGSRYVRTLSDVLALVLAILAPIGLAALSWHLMESRLIRYGHTFAYRTGLRTTEPDPVVNGKGLTP